jgi:hypothetical protein
MIKQFLLFYLLSISCVCVAQTDLKANRFEFANKFELSTYLDLQYLRYGGNELKIDLITLQDEGLQLSISSGFFLVDSREESNYHMLFSYVPIYLNAAGFSKNKKWYAKINIGVPLYSNNATSIITDDHLWPTIGEVSGELLENPNPQLREKIKYMNEIRCGWYFSKHFGVNLGVKSYNVKTSLYRAKRYFFPTLGLTFRFNYKPSTKK